MLNLSDKELDRLSREAAQEHDPGDVLGPRSWEKLEPRLDTDLGKSGPNPLRGVRRFPFYYVPAILMVAAGFYFVKQSYKSKQNEPSGSPPSVKTQSTPAASTQPDSSFQHPEHNINSTPSVSSPATAGPAIANPATANPVVGNPIPANPIAGNPATANSVAANPANTNSATTNSVAANPSTANPAITPASPTHSATAPTDRSATNPTDHSATNPTDHSATTPSAHPGSTVHYLGTASATHANADNNHERPTNASINTAANIAPNTAANPAANTAANTTTRNTNSNKTHSGRRNKGKHNTLPSATTSPADLTATGASTSSHRRTSASAGAPGTPGAPETNKPSETTETSGADAAPGNSAPTGTRGANSSATTNQPRELAFSTIRKPRSLKQGPSISDSALRNYTAKGSASTIQLGKNKSLRINRTLQFGLSVAPDFSSVNSLAGDKPGSSIGLTLDYQFANHWYLSTGLLLDRKNYAARPQDYHVPNDYYWRNNLLHVDLVKGSFNMLEIPLNLRYDFSTTGSTLFFASAGLSSYLATGENSNFYFNFFGQEVCRSVNYPDKNNYLFSSVNLSLGVETGLSDNLSLLVAPYVKLPSRGIGFGQIQMNSVGINFALKFAPVISRKRK